MAQRNKKLRFPKLPRDVPQGWAAIIAALIALAGTIYTVALQNHSSLSGAPPGASSPMAATALQTSAPASSPVQLPAKWVGASSS